MTRDDELPGAPAKTLVWSRPERIAFALFALAVLGSLPFLVHPWFDAARDSTTYMAGARSILAGEGYCYLGEAFTLRPPGYSLLIAPVIALRGVDFQALNLVTSLWGALAVLLLHLFLRVRIGWVLSLVACAGIWLNPGFRQMSNQVLADVPTIACLVGALLVERWCSRRTDWRRELLLGLVIGLGAYVRSHVLLLIPAILAARSLQRLWRPVDPLPWGRFVAVRLVPFALVAFLLGLPWSLRNAGADVRVPADQTLHHSYETWMWNRDTGDPSSERLGLAEVLTRAPDRASDVAGGLGSRLRTSNPRAGRSILAGFLLLAMLVEAGRRREAVDFFLLGTLAFFAISLTLPVRLLLPVYVFALPAGLELARRLLTAAAGERRAIGVVAVVASLLLFLDFQPRLRWRQIEKQARQDAELAAEVDRLVEPDARLAAMLGPNYSVALDRPVYSLGFALRRSGFPGIEELIDHYRIDTVLIGPDEAAGLATYLEERYGPLEVGQHVRVARVR